MQDCSSQAERTPQARNELALSERSRSAAASSPHRPRATVRTPIRRSGNRFEGWHPELHDNATSVSIQRSLLQRRPAVVDRATTSADDEERLRSVSAGVEPPYDLSNAHAAHLFQP
jgi:hypothetical protein